MVTIKQLRKAKGMTQKDLALKAGVSLQSIHRYEAEDRSPSIDIAIRIAQALGCTVDDLIQEKEPA